MMEPYVLETPRTVLRPFAESDAADLYEFSSIPAVGHAAGWPPHRSPRESLEIIRTVFSAPYTFAVVERGSGKVIGSAGFTGRQRTAYSTADEIGYALHPDWWGRGIMTEVVRELVRFGFETRGLEIIWCSHYAENPASRRVIEKSGFSYVCTEIVNDETGPHSTAFYTMFRQQWRGETG